ncbi:SAV_2336 N-terminal domain-related protein [Streptomyces sp. NPDC048484]|uniref:SAV_2336 N-terminal domain-related protein n=1 Tax=Streptomyces sp. NPDC048484 TaxID=3155146 RepID=UPI00342F8990
MRSDADAGGGVGPDADAGGGAGAAYLADLLAQAGGGAGPTSVELAELLWLAQHMPAPEAPAPTTTPADLTTRPTGSPGPAGGAGPNRSADPPQGATSPHRPADETHHRPGHLDVPEPRENRVPLRLPGGPAPANGREGPAAPGRPARPDGSYTSLLAPAPPMLSHPLTLQRALRPLKRRVPSPVGQELDEAATAHRIARLGAAPRWWLPVLRPTTERWLTLHLVHDAGPTMPVWRPLVRELHTALAQSGVFRTVELHRLETDGRVRRPGSQESFADGRTVTLLISDCMGPQWRDGPAGTRWYTTLRRWSANMPVALVQPLPERLWRTTALPATTARIAAQGPAAPNSAYDVDSYALDGLPRDVLPLPVLEASAVWLANWSSLVAGRGRLPGAVGLLGAAPPVAPVDERGRSDVERLSPEELLLRFRSLASPEAFRLAGHLAVGPPKLFVMRLVQAAIEKNPQPQHLAEVILSGALTAVPGAAGSYAFRPGVRELLLRTLPRTARGRTSELLARVGALIDVRAGVAAGEFRVAVPGPGGATAGGEPFAAVREESVQRLGGTLPKPADTGLVLGRYRLVRHLGRGKHVMEAQDTRLDRTVAVHRYTVAPERQRQRFLESARTLAGVAHPNVLAVYDYGFEGHLGYLVTEFVAGVTLAELTAQGGFRLPWALLAPLARQVTQGLAAVHARGMAHGHLAPSYLLFGADGTVRISGFPLERLERPERPERLEGSLGLDESEEADGSDGSKDLHDFGLLLRELAGGETQGELSGIPAEHRQRFTDAVALLLSPDTETQHRGRDLFLSPAFGAVVEAVAADRIRYRLLGPVRIHQGDLSQPAHSPQEQALLCLLLLRNGRPVTDGELTEGLWGDRPPQHPERLLATYASALRGTLGPGLLATTAYGYALHAGLGTVDVERCKELVAEAESHREGGDLTAAREAVQGALDLWYGDPLDGVPGPAAQTTRTRLHALRLTLCVTRAELDLELGRSERAATDLEELLRSHPEREDLRRLHILALKDQGRTAEAMESYEAYAQLQDRQFSEPNPTLLELYRELRAAPDDGRPASTMECVDPGDHRGAHSTLAHTIPDLVPDPPPGRRDLVNGPFSTRHRGTVRPPEPGRTAVVFQPPDGAPALLGPDEFTGTPPSGPRIAYYEVDLTPHRATHELSLPASRGGAFAASVELSWHVDDPVALVLGKTTNVSERLLDHLVREARRITRRHPVHRVGAAQHAVHDGLRDWPVPGLSVACSVRLTSEAEPRPVPGATRRATGPAAGRPPESATALVKAPYVLIGFDGPLVRLYTGDAEKQASRELAALLAELRDPEAALRGEPLTSRGAPTPPLEGRPNPLDLLRAFAGHPLGADLRRRLNRIEERAVSTAASTPFSDSLLSTLNSLGRRTAVVADNAPSAVWKYLQAHGRLAGLVTGGVHGRADDLTRLMPNADCLLRALEHLGATPKDTVMVGSSVAELTAAKAVGLRFLGYTRSEPHRQRLVRAGCELTTASWAPLLQALPNT